MCLCACMRVRARVFKVLLVSCKSVRHTVSPHMEQHGTVVYESNKWLNMYVAISTFYYDGKKHHDQLV